MALNFDDDHEPSFQDLVRTARADVLKGREMTDCWSELADQHSFFKDIAKEGRTRGETLGGVLAAATGISEAVRTAEAADALVASQSAPPPPFTQPGSSTGSSDARQADTTYEAEALVRVADAYLQLYSLTPVPTRAQWLASLQSVCRVDTGSSMQGGSAGGASPAQSSPPLSTSAVGRYLARLQTSLSSVERELAGEGDADGEDGSFAEEELRELVRCCLTAGRRVARHASLSKAAAKTVREMVKALQDYVGSATLEW